MRPIATELQLSVVLNIIDFDLGWSWQGCKNKELRFQHRSQCSTDCMLDDLVWLEVFNPQRFIISSEIQKTGATHLVRLLQNSKVITNCKVGSWKIRSGQESLSDNVAKPLPPETGVKWVVGWVGCQVSAAKAYRFLTHIKWMRNGDKLQQRMT